MHIYRLVGGSLKRTNDYKPSFDMLVDGVKAIGDMDATIPLHNMIANGNVERELKALMAAGIQKTHSSVLYVMDKQFALKKKPSRQQVDLLLIDDKRRAVAVECKCTFAFDTKSNVIDDAMRKARRNFAVFAGEQQVRSSIVHFLIDTTFEKHQLKKFPDSVRTRYERLYNRNRKEPEELLRMYREADKVNERQIKGATVVKMERRSGPIKFAVLIIDLKNVCNKARK